MKTFVLSLMILTCTTTFAAASGDLPNFAKVADGVYRGGRPGPDGLVTLKNLGVKTDINLQGGDLNWTDPAVVSFMSWWEPGETPENIAREHSLADDLQISFYAAPLNSISPVGPEEDTEIDAILATMSNPAMQPVYVHCEHGRDRTGLIIALYRVKFEGLSVQAAHDEWTAMGHSGVGAYFTGNLDKYFYAKAAALTAP